MWYLIVSVPDHCISFYLVYKFKKIVGRADFSDQFKKNYRLLQTLVVLRLNVPVNNFSVISGRTVTNVLDIT